ncbi:hypothetical protein RRF57_005043 [Xylaria bambusicola]|uniref:Uncharacterized protein n=1 Tax=Xylaria bambusicola TaxID=326684 RepID=A0AAN7UL90_9PEZI
MATQYCITNGDRCRYIGPPASVSCMQVKWRLRDGGLAGFLARAKCQIALGADRKLSFII